jgi:cysteine desulfurase
VLHSLEAVEREDIEIAMLTVDERGRVDCGELESLLSNGEGKKTLVSLMHANNEIGTLHDLARISALCQQYGASFHTDTVQTIGHLPIDLSQTRIDFLTGGAHKFHGPKGCGFIYINGDNRIKPWIDGGSQERNMRGGTENVAGIVGMARALDLACEHLEEYRAHIEDVRNYFIRRLTEEFEDIRFNGDFDGQYLYTILSVSFPPSPTSELMLLQLDIEGVSASGGSACSSGAEAGSHVLQAIGAAVDRKSIRFSFSHYNTREEVDLVVEKLGKWVKKRG